MADIAEVLKRAKPPERFEDICLDSSLTARHADLQRQLEDPATVAEGADKRRKIADDIHKLEGQIRAETVRFHLRGLSAYDRDEWLDAHPPREGKQEGFNATTGEPALVAACCLDPQMTAEQAADLRRALGAGDWERLAKAAWEASTQESSIPYSFLASGVRRQPSEK
jgi:hypothetical protein